LEVVSLEPLLLKLLIGLGAPELPRGLLASETGYSGRLALNYEPLGDVQVGS